MSGTEQETRAMTGKRNLDAVRSLKTILRDITWLRDEITKVTRTIANQQDTLETYRYDLTTKEAQLKESLRELGIDKMSNLEVLSLMANL